MAPPPRVEIISKEFIKPYSPTKDGLKQHKLPLLDQLQVPTYIPLVFFYENVHSSPSFSQRSQLLKQSLSKVLTKFYPLAGTLKDNLLVDCNDSGALYVEAQVHALLSEATDQDGNAKIEEVN
ncbi:hypothetical protein ACH5RR_028833 [Cinchona calisaya]|uniref:Uncharacterized protein n=1 Tax=Cinchona calisaya TaxID=153742 RepID=A0ABD2YUE6_9GENT